MNGWLEAAVLAYPRDVRDAERDVLLGLAADMVDGGSPIRREALGLAADGLRIRCGRRRIGTAPWADALRIIGLPIAATFLALTVAGTLSLMHEPAWIGWWWSAAIVGSLAATAGLALGLRSTALLGGLALLGLCLLDTQTQSSRAVIEVYVWNGDTGSGFDLAALASCTLGAAVVIAAALAGGRRPRGTRALFWAIAWAAGLVLAAALISPPLWPFTGFRQIDEGIELSAATTIVGLALVPALALLVTRRPVRRLAGALAIVAISPTLILAALYRLPVDSATLGWGLMLGLIILTLITVRALALSTTPREPGGERG